MSTAAQVIAVPKPGANATLQDFLNYQDKLVETGQLEFLGRGKRVVLEAEKDTPTQPVGVTSKLGHCLEWYNQPHPKGGYVDSYLPLAQSLDRKMILCLEPVLRRDIIGRLIQGAVGLPDMPDPSWKPTSFKNTDEAEKFFDEQRAKGLSPLDPPMIQQDLNRLTGKMIGGTEILVFQPVMQVLFQPVLPETGRLQATYWALHFQFDPATKTYPAFLVDRKTGAAHFYGGKYQIIEVG